MVDLVRTRKEKEVMETVVLGKLPAIFASLHRVINYKAICSIEFGQYIMTLLAFPRLESRIFN